MCCMNLYKNRYMLIDNRYTLLTKDNFVGKGGACEYRKQEDMMRQTELLIKKFGNVIRPKRATVAREIINEGERSLNAPF